MGSFGGVGIGLSFVFGCILMGLIAGLYYLLWWKNKLSHNSTSSSSPQIGDPEAGQGSKDFGEDGIEAELMRAHNLRGPPRFLFTINEESKEDLESEDGKSRSRTKSLNELLLSSPTAKGSWCPYGNPLFEWLKEADVEGLRSSPPPKFKFLKDAEDKLLRKMLAEQNQRP